jgi:hypothetical protein
VISNAYDFALFLQEIRQAAEFLDLPELLVFVTNIQAHEEFLNTDLKQHYRKVRTATFQVTPCMQI